MLCAHVGTILGVIYLANCTAVPFNLMHTPPQSFRMLHIEPFLLYFLIPRYPPIWKRDFCTKMNVTHNLNRELHACQVTYKKCFQYYVYFMYVCTADDKMKRVLIAQLTADICKLGEQQSQ